MPRTTIKQRKYTNFDLIEMIDGDIKLIASDGSEYFLEKKLRDKTAKVIALNKIPVELFDPEKRKPVASKDDVTFSEDVCIIDEDGLNGLAYYSFEDAEWKFHTDTMVDYNEPGAKTKWMWYYPVVNKSIFKPQS